MRYETQHNPAPAGLYPTYQNRDFPFRHYIDISNAFLKVSKSATTNRAGGMRKAPRRGRRHALLLVADLILLILSKSMKFHTSTASGRGASSLIENVFWLFLKKSLSDLSGRSRRRSLKRFHPSTFDIRNSTVLRFAFPRFCGSLFQLCLVSHEILGDNYFLKATVLGFIPARKPPRLLLRAGINPISAKLF